MALVLADRVQQTGTANTTVSFTLSGSVAGFQSFAVVGDTNTTYYSATDSSGNWEVGLGTYSTTGPTLTRTTVSTSSNSNAAVTFSGTVNVFVAYPSGKSVNKDASGNVSGYAIENSTIGAVTPAAGTHTTLGITGTTNQVSSVAVSSDPAAPSAGNLKTFAKTVAGGYTAPAFLNATNIVSLMQSNFGFKKIILGSVNGGASVHVFLPATALSNPTTVGTTTAISSANTSFFTRINKFSIVSAATAASFSSLVYNSNNTQVLTLGVSGTPNAGGFLWIYNFGIGDTVASPRTFVGLSTSTAAATNVEPSTLTNVIGVGQGAANTNLFVYYGGSAAQTPIDLGANFPTGTSATDWYQVVLYAPPNSNNTVYYQVTRQNTGNVATGTLTGTAGTALPANTSNLYWRGWRTNNGTASAVTLQYGAMYIETDY